MFRIWGGRRLQGELTVGSAKNAVLPILAAAVMAYGDVCIVDCPMLMDVENMLCILRTLGCTVRRQSDSVTLCADAMRRWEMPEHLSKKLRSSIFMMGSLLGRFRRATVTYPGGCDIGLRPIDLHLKGLRALGVSVEEHHGMIELDGSNMHGGEVYLDFPSVGATENVMMAATLIRGRTVIHNAAREPEIRDLQDFINAMGGKIAGAGLDTIVIDGVSKLHGVEYRPIPDRIVAGTLLTAAAATHGDVLLRRVRKEDLGAPLDVLRQMGCDLSVAEDAVRIRADGALCAFSVSTQPFPGFPTDLQAQFMALACTANGTSILMENLFENRFAHAAQLRRMGADILIHHRIAVVRGGTLNGAKVHASDLRGGAALVIAALSAEGESIVENIAPIDRGYAHLETMLSALGADVCRADGEREENIWDTGGENGIPPWEC